MRLRTIGLMSTLALGLFVAALLAEAQQAGKVYRIGFLDYRLRSMTPDPFSSRTSLLLCAKPLDHLFLKVGPMGKAVERRHFPVPDSPSRKRINELGHLIMRLCANDKDACPRACKQSACMDLAVLG